MSVGKKLVMSIVWLILYVLSAGLVLVLRHIGTTWINSAGGIRVIVLALFSLGTFIPLGLAVLSWFDRPKRLYIKLR